MKTITQNRQTKPSKCQQNVIMNRKIPSGTEIPFIDFSNSPSFVPQCFVSKDTVWLRPLTSAGVLLQRGLATQSSSRLRDSVLHNWEGNDFSCFQPWTARELINKLYNSGTVVGKRKQLLAKIKGISPLFNITFVGIFILLRNLMFRLLICKLYFRTI